MASDGRFDRFSAILVDRLEGGYVNDPDDPGGETKYGISKRSYPDLDIPNLSRDQAIEIYRRDFWFGLNLHLIRNETLQFKLFDCAVPMGGTQMTRLLQRALVRCGMAVKVDGEMGPDTIGAANNADRARLYAEFIRLCYLFLRGLKAFGAFGGGWTYRLVDVAG